MKWTTVRVAGGIACAVAVAANAAWAIWRDQHRRESGPAWPTVRGTITESRVQSCNKGARREPQVLYTYEIGGKSYDGEVEFKSRHCGSEQEAQAIVAAYTPTFTFEVHVDPKDPSESLVLAP